MESAPTAGGLLNVWEEGRFRTPVERAGLLLALAVPTASAGERAGFGIGRRDQELLALRERIFGLRMTALANCPACEQEVEMDFSVSDIRIQPPSEADGLRGLLCGGYDVRFRLPTCDDLAALERQDDPAARKSALLQRCVAEARRNGEPTAAETLPDAVTVALSARMAELDPLGDIRLDLRCPACAHRWQSPLDIGSFLWAEVSNWALRILREVHELASAYGWSESDILAMSPWRREAYLELIQQ